MDRLPTEILDEIVSLLAASQESHYGLYKSMLASYATINRTWQEVIEHETFRRININTDRLPELINILGYAAGDRRIRSVRTLEFLFLPDQVPPLLPGQDSELRDQQPLTDESFPRDTRMLFALLKGWEERLEGSGGIDGIDPYQLRLHLSKGYRQKEASVPLPAPPIENIALPPRLADVPQEEPVVYHGRNLAANPWQGFPLESAASERPEIDVRYVGEEKLPELSIVSSVVVGRSSSIHPESLVQILSRMKRLDHFEGYLFEETRSLDLTREYRKVLSRCLHLLPQSLSVFYPEFDSSQVNPQTSYSVLADPQRDDLCIGIRALSGQLKKLYLDCLRISSAIFEGDGDGSYPDWSRLEEIDITYPALSSTGQWFANPATPEVFLGGYTNENYDRVRYTVPNPELLNELYAAAGKAKRHMPHLKYMGLSLNSECNRHKFSYGFDHDRKSIIIALESTVPFEFSDDVAEAWGFAMGEVNSFEEGDITVSEVLLS